MLTLSKSVRVVVRKEYDTGQRGVSGGAGFYVTLTCTVFFIEETHENDFV
jgi:hypothetical protein